MRLATVSLMGAVLMSAALPSACIAQDAAIAQDADILFHSNDRYREAGFPFSEAVEVDGWIYLSGALGVDPDTLQLAPGGIEAESRQTMDNIKATLERLGSSMDRVVKCTVMIENMAEWPAFNAVYATYFDGNYPARSAFGADGLALGAKVEVECIAKR